LGITKIDNLRNALSPRVIVSYGSQLDVDPADLVANFDRDPAVGSSNAIRKASPPAAAARFSRSSPAPANPSWFQ